MRGLPGSPASSARQPLLRFDAEPGAGAIIRTSDARKGSAARGYSPMGETTVGRERKQPRLLGGPSGDSSDLSASQVAAWPARRRRPVRLALCLQAQFRERPSKGRRRREMRRHVDVAFRRQLPAYVLDACARSRPGQLIGTFDDVGLRVINHSPRTAERGAGLPRLAADQPVCVLPDKTRSVRLAPRRGGRTPAICRG
jgi:hypothetical protein